MWVYKYKIHTFSAKTSLRQTSKSIKCPIMQNCKCSNQKLHRTDDMKCRMNFNWKLWLVKTFYHSYLSYLARLGGLAFWFAKSSSSSKSHGNTSWNTCWYLTVKWRTSNPWSICDQSSTQTVVTRRHNVLLNYSNKMYYVIYRKT